jgi:hypothetical protein
MRLDFNVLWVEDQPESVKSQIDAIAKAVGEEGFELSVVQYQTLDAVQGRIRDHVFADQIDLVLVDWDLGPDLKGQEVIAAVRERIRYRDIIFYSAETDTEKLREYSAGLEGVYCVSRVDLVDDVKEIFETLIRKVLDIDHMRGIVMGATSDIDEIVRECLTEMHEQLSEKGKASVISSALKYINDAVESQSKSAAKLGKEITLKELFGAHGLLDSSRRLRLLLSLLNEGDQAERTKYVESAKVYLKDVLPRRNDLGHKVLIPEGAPHIVTLSGKKISVEEMRELRKQIIQSRKDIRELLVTVRGK